MDFVSVPVFTDVSEKLRNFNAFKQGMPLAEMVNCVNEELFFSRRHCNGMIFRSIKTLIFRLFLFSRTMSLVELSNYGSQ